MIKRKRILRRKSLEKNRYISFNLKYKLYWGEKMSYVVTSKVKALIKKHKMNTAGDFVHAMDKEIENHVSRAVARAKSNGRKTVRAGDL